MYASLHQILRLFTGGCIPLHNNAGQGGSAQWGLMASFLLVFDKREVITGSSVQATVLRHPLVLLQIGSHYPGQISIIQFSYFHREEEGSYFINPTLPDRHRQPPA